MLKYENSNYIEMLCSYEWKWDGFVGGEWGIEIRNSVNENQSCIFVIVSKLPEIIISGYFGEILVEGYLMNSVPHIAIVFTRALKH